MKLLGRIILRPLLGDLARTALTIVSIALGVGVVVGIDLAGDAASGSFLSSLHTLAGTVDFEIEANGGIDERWMGRLAALPFDAKFAPVIETQACIVRPTGPCQSVPLYGVDLLGREGLIVSRVLADRLDLHAGGTVDVTIGDAPRRFPITEIADRKGAEFLGLDIAAAQQALGRYGVIDRIDVTAGPHADAARLEKTLLGLLPAAYTLAKPGARGEENQRMLRAFRWNLRVLSYISLVVGAFLIYNTVAVSVVRRRPEIGVLRALGTSRGTILRLFLGEAAMFGLAGSVAGVFLGRLMAQATVGLIAETVNALYTSSRPGVVTLGAGEALGGIAAGIAVALLSALGPAREAMRVPPTEAMGRGAHEHRAVLRWRRDLAWAALFAAGALAASQAPPAGPYPVGGYVAALLAIGAAAFAAPAVVLGVHRLTRGAVRRLFAAPGLLAGRSLASSLARTSVIVGALATAIAMMASVGIMVASFRETVEVWLGTQLRADLYVRAAGRTGAGNYPALSSDVPAIAAGVPGVEAVDIFHGMEFRYHGERATLGAGIADIVRRYGRLHFLPGENRDAILRSLPGRDRAIVSEPFANKHHVRAGDRLVLELRDRRVPVTVAGIYYEYSSSQGFVVLDRSTLLRYLPGQPPTNVAVYLRRGADAQKAERELRQRLGSYRVVVMPNAVLRRDALAIFDRTFAITWALEAVAIVVATLGAANALLALVLDRRREIGLLRYLGASAVQVRRMIVLEAALLGLLAALIGLALGFALSLLLIFVVNKQSFGWTIQFHPPAGLLSGAIFLVWCATVVAALYPARAAARLDPLEAIHEE